MKSLLDENADAQLASHLRTLGHEATRIADDHPSGLSDVEVLAIAVREGRILITDDRDFGELVFQHGASHTGILYFRLGVAIFPERRARLDHVLAHHAHQLDRFLTVTRNRVRIGDDPDRLDAPS